MKKKFFTILLALVAGIGFSWASTITVTWNNDDITGSGNSFTKDGVTITAGVIDFTDKNFSRGGTFTTTLGNFTKIEVTARYVRVSGTGWSGSTWTGNASSVSFSGEIYGRGTGVTMVFTIEPTTVDVTGVTLSQSEAAMTMGGETLTLTATVAPDNATDKTVTWTSSDPTVATVADGVVTAVAAGTATITATATNGTDDTTDDKTATCTITVTDPDQEAADAVLALFDALPAVENITLDNKEAIEAARAAYEALTDEQKALVTPEDLAKLTAAEEALAAAEKAAADQVAADVVVALFDALPAVANITLDDKAAIEAARAAYEALTTEQKALVTPEDLAKLTAAEEALAAAEKAAADQEAADAVVVLFDALPAVADITLEDKAAIEAARAAYDALTADQKALVSAEDLAKLTAAEEALAALESQGVENVQGNVKNVKILENGQIFILRSEKVYTLQGQEVK